MASGWRCGRIGGLAAVLMVAWLGASSANAALPTDATPLRLSTADVLAVSDAESASATAEETEPPTRPAAEAGEAGEKMSASEIANQLSNPVGELWCITNQYNVNELRGKPFSGCGAPIINVDWTKGCREGLTLPVGISVSKVFKIGKLPIKLGFEYDYAVVHPHDDLGQRNVFRFTVTPVLPVLVKENLFGY